MHAGTIAGAGLMKDPLLQEIREYRDQYAIAFGYDVHAMGHDLRKREKRSVQKIAHRDARTNVKCK